MTAARTGCPSTMGWRSRSETELPFADLDRLRGCLLGGAPSDRGAQKMGYVNFGCKL